MQPAYVCHFFYQPSCDFFRHDQYVLVKIVLPFQSGLVLDNKSDHDAIKYLVAGGVETYFSVQCSYGRQQLVLVKRLVKLS